MYLCSFTIPGRTLFDYYPNTNAQLIIINHMVGALIAREAKSDQLCPRRYHTIMKILKSVRGTLVSVGFCNLRLDQLQRALHGQHVRQHEEHRLHHRVDSLAQPDSQGQFGGVHHVHSGALLRQRLAHARRQKICSRRQTRIIS